MLFNKGHQERIRRFMLEDSAYQRALMKNSPWTIRDIMAMKNRDDAVLATPSGGMGDEPPDGGEITKYFTFNQTGNVMVSSTVAEEEKLDPDVKKAFKKAIVFFGAAAAALSKKGKTLYDYDALDQVITSLGIFSALHREDRSFNYSSKTVSISREIVAAVLGGVSAGAGALAIAEATIASLGSEIKVTIEKSEASKKVAHLLFVVENLMGIPIVTVLLFYIEAKEAEFVTQVPCGSSSQKEISFNYHQDTFILVDPEYIDQFTEDFQENPEYRGLIERLAEQIT